MGNSNNKHKGPQPTDMGCCDSCLKKGAGTPGGKGYEALSLKSNGNSGSTNTSSPRTSYGGADSSSAPSEHGMQRPSTPLQPNTVAGPQAPQPQVDKDKPVARVNNASEGVARSLGTVPPPPELPQQHRRPGTAPSAGASGPRPTQTQMLGRGNNAQQHGQPRGGPRYQGAPQGTFGRGRIANGSGGNNAATRNLQLKYDVKEVLGLGSTSTCHRCLERATGEAFACKIIDKKVVAQKFNGLLDQFHVEITVLQQLRHPHIIYLKDVFESDSHIHMVMEFMQGGELFDFVVDRGTLTEGEAAGMLRGVTSAVAYMHSMGIIHRDLKPENLLLARRIGGGGASEAVVKIIDFGLSKILEDNIQTQSFLGTRGYLAPEMLQRESYSKAVDVWALGVICFVLLCGCLPFDDDSSRINKKSAVAKFVLRFPKWAQNLSPSAKQLLRGLLDVDPVSRFTAQAALDHSWMSGGGAAAQNALESPRALRRLPRLGTPQAQRDAGNAPTYGSRAAGGASGTGTPSGDEEAKFESVRQADFAQEREELDQALAKGASRPRKYSIP